MDTRVTRRAAEKAARDLIASRAAHVGALAVTHAEHARLTCDVAAAAECGRQLIADAHAEAARLLDGATQLAHDGQQRYADAHHAATTAGWTTADLTALGYPPAQPTSSRARRQPDRHEHRPTGTPTTAPPT